MGNCCKKKKVSGSIESSSTEKGIDKTGNDKKKDTKKKGIDVLRTKIFNFASQESFDDRTKIVVLDECLEENEEVILIENGKEKYVKLKDLEKGKVYECLAGVDVIDDEVADAGLVMQDGHL